MTQQQALDWIKGGWKSDPKVTTINGAIGIDVDNYYGHQCKDFANAYAVWLGHPLTAGDAITAWNVPQDPWYAKLPNTPDLVFQPGDIFVMSPNHIGLVIEGADTSQFTSVDQNWFNSNSTVGSPPALVNHNYQHMLGVLRPQFNGGTMIDSTSTGLLRIGHSEIGGWNYEETHRGQHDQAFHAAWDGHSLDEFIWAQWNDGNAQIFRATRNEAMAKYPASATRIHDLEATNASQASTISAINSDNANKDQEIAKLKAELALAGSDTQQLNALGLSLKWLIQRLGVK